MKAKEEMVLSISQNDFEFLDQEIKGQYEGRKLLSLY